MLGFHATLAKQSLMKSDKESFFYQTEQGKEIYSKLMDNHQKNHIISQNVVSWDIGGGSMQLAWVQTDGIIRVNGSQDSSTLFANEVIALKQKTMTDSSRETPNPLSSEQMEAAIDLAKEKAEKLATPSFLEYIRSKNPVIFGIGQLHTSNQSYINKLLDTKSKFCYTKSDLKKAVGCLVNKSNEQIAASLNILAADARNRFTSMLMVLGFMEYFQIKTINITDVSMINGIFFREQH